MHWPEPIVGGHVDRDAGPVLVTVEYRVAEAKRGAFLKALEGTPKITHLIAAR